MAWDDEMPAVVRGLINDTAATPDYTDDQLANTILISGLVLQAQLRFPQAYTISVADGTLSPDPTKAAGRDDSFIVLACLRSAYGIVLAEIKAYAKQGIEIQDGKSRIKLARDAQTLNKMAESFKDLLDEAVYAYKTGGSDGLGQVIVSPYPYLAGDGLMDNWLGLPWGRTNHCLGRY